MNGKSESSSRYTVLWLLSLLSVITYLDRVCIAVAGPAIQDALHLDPKQWGWVVGIFTISYSAFEIPSGVLGDRIGPRRVLTRIVLWWSAFTALTGVSWNYSSLLFMRFCFGAGEAGAYPNISASLSKWFPSAERARALGVVWMASRLGGAVAPLLVIPLQAHFGWRAPFFVFTVLGVVWAYVWNRSYREGKSNQANPFPPLERHKGQGVSWRKVLRHRNMIALAGMYFSYVYGLFFFNSWMHTYLVKGRGFSQSELLLTALPFLLGAVANGLGGVASDVLVKRWGNRWGRRSIAIVGVGSAALFVLATPFASDKTLTLTLLTLGACGCDFMQPTAWAVCTDIGKPNTGAITGLMNTAGQAGAFVASIAFGYLVEKSGSYDLPLFIIAGMLGISALSWLAIDANDPLVLSPLQGMAKAST